jgi:hypothetical protein
MTGVVELVIATGVKRVGALQRADSLGLPGCRLGQRLRQRPRARIAATKPTAHTTKDKPATAATSLLIDLDDELLADAQRELHTSGVSDTVRTALRRAAAAAARARQVRWLGDGGSPSWPRRRSAATHFPSPSAASPATSRSSFTEAAQP